MTIINKEYSVGAVFLRQPWKALTFSEIQKLSGKKSKSYVYSSLEGLEKDGLIISERVGKRALVYKLKLDSPFAQNYWGFLKEYESKATLKFPMRIIENIRAKMPTPFFVMLVTGSYARGKQNKKSDLDVVIICNDDSDRKKINKELTHIAEMSIPPVHLYVFTKDEFLEMLLNDKENYGKEIARNCLVFFGGAVYYSILEDAIKHGFRG